MRRMLYGGRTTAGRCRARQLAWRTVAAALMAVQSACYSYVAAPAGQQQRAAAVRVELQRPVAVELGDVTVQNVTRAEGEVVQWTETALVLSTAQVTSAIGQRFLGQYQTVYLPRNTILEVEVKRLSVPRTGIVLGAVAVLAGVVGSLVGGGVGSGDGPGDGAPPTK